MIGFDAKVKLWPVMGGTRGGERDFSMRLPKRFRGMEISTMPSIYREQLRDRLCGLVNGRTWLYSVREIPMSDGVLKIKEVSPKVLLGLKEVHFFSGQIDVPAFRDGEGEIVYLSMAMLSPERSYTHADLSNWFRGINPVEASRTGFQFGITDPRRFLEELA